AVGLIPSGSKDPLALRRAGQGIVRILWDQGWGGHLKASCFQSVEGVGAKATKGRDETLQALESFFQDRVAYQLELAGYAGSVRRSALAAGWSDLQDLKARCEALSKFAEDPRFASLAQSAKRIGNILKDEQPSDAFEVATFQQAEEKVLAEELTSIEGLLDATDGKASGVGLHDLAFGRLLDLLAELAEPLEAFFTAVMVKCEDDKLRAARLSLLHRLRQAFLRVADFSQWQ
ncbi:MAG TPA: glycine--tRNA ligase subunit beta, partial [Holophagaceae bacterium]|nr:glycine--tRNA ligase subunit beta [Holophagaceae bacterium]